MATTTTTTTASKKRELDWSDFPPGTVTDYT